MFKKKKKESKELGQRTSQHRSRSTRQAQFETQKRIKEKAIKGRERGAKQSSQPKAKTRPEHTQIAFVLPTPFILFLSALFYLLICLSLNPQTQ